MMIGPGEFICMRGQPCRDEVPTSRGLLFALSQWNFLAYNIDIGTSTQLAGRIVSPSISIDHTGFTPGKAQLPPVNSP